MSRDRATRLAWRWRHSFAGPPGPAARRATVARRSRSCAERKSASDHSRRRPKRHLRQLWGSAPAPLRACALHHSSCVTLRLRFNLPQPGVSIIRAAPHVLTAFDQLVVRQQVLSASSLFLANDADNDTLLYFFYDNTPVTGS